MSHACTLAKDLATLVTGYCVVYISPSWPPLFSVCAILWSTICKKIFFHGCRPANFCPSAMRDPSNTHMHKNKMKPRIWAAAVHAAQGIMNMHLAWIRRHIYIHTQHISSQYHYNPLQRPRTAIVPILYPAENLPVLSVTEGMPFQVCFELSVPPVGSDITVNIKDNPGVNGLCIVKCLYRPCTIHCVVKYHKLILTKHLQLA